MYFLNAMFKTVVFTLFFVYNLFVRLKCFSRVFTYEIDLCYFRYYIYNFFFKMCPVRSNRNVDLYARFKLLFPYREDIIYIQWHGNLLRNTS